MTNKTSYEHGETLKHFKIDLKKNKKFSSVEVKKKNFTIIKPQNQLKITKIDFLNFQSPIQLWDFNKNS